MYAQCKCTCQNIFIDAKVSSSLIDKLLLIKIHTSLFIHQTNLLWLSMILSYIPCKLYSIIKGWFSADEYFERLFDILFLLKSPIIKECCIIWKERHIHVENLPITAPSLTTFHLKLSYKFPVQTFGNKNVFSLPMPKKPIVHFSKSFSKVPTIHNKIFYFASCWTQKYSSVESTGKCRSISSLTSTFF